ncbi:MAG TPA: hypothetical protein VK928_01210 [Longimicrobiales bacterium]|nr:hypothetical protein [Longimicrobiales bacterium]
MSRRMVGAVLVLLGALAAAAPAGAQQSVELPPPNVYFTVQGMYARPVGEFRDYVQHGGGLNAAVVWPVTTASPLALRADGGFVVYGSETKEVCFSSTVGCRIRLDLTTTNSIAYLNAGPQLMVPTGTVRPYINGAIGFSYFATTSSVKGVNDGDDIASDTNFDDITLAFAGGGGVMVSLSRGSTPILLDVGARFNRNGEVEYLKKGDIEETPTGIRYTPTRSEADLVTFQVGVTIGNRPQNR